MARNAPSDGNGVILDKDSIYRHFAYSNLQDKYGAKEGLQTKAIMQLNDFFPLSFSAITIWQGSYKSKQNDLPFDERQKERKLQEVLAEDNFMVAHEGKGMGYNFTKHKGAWKRELKRIVDLSYDRVRKGPKDETDKVKNIAFSEYVNDGIMRSHEKRVAQFVQSLLKQHEKKAKQSTDPKMLSARVCGPAADRSVKVNMTFMSAQKPGNEHAIKVAAFALGRAKCAKGRLPTRERVITEFGAHNKMAPGTFMRDFFRDIDADSDDPLELTDSAPKRPAMRRISYG